MPWIAIRSPQLLMAVHPRKNAQTLESLNTLGSSGKKTKAVPILKVSEARALWRHHQPDTTRRRAPRCIVVKLLGQAPMSDTRTSIGQVLRSKSVHASLNGFTGAWHPPKNSAGRISSVRE